MGGGETYPAKYVYVGTTDDTRFTMKRIYCPFILGSAQLSRMNRSYLIRTAATGVVEITSTVIAVAEDGISGAFTITDA